MTDMEKALNNLGNAFLLFREKAIQAIKSLCMYDGETPQMIWSSDAIDAVRKIPESDGWISVKDRMPDDGVFVLVCNDDGHMMVAKYESEVMRWEYKYINYDWDVWDDEEQGPVCWWTPLPEPPKGVNTDATD